MDQYADASQAAESAWLESFLPSMTFESLEALRRYIAVHGALCGYEFMEITSERQTKSNGTNGTQNAVAVRLPDVDIRVYQCSHQYPGKQGLCPFVVFAEEHANGWVVTRSAIHFSHNHPNWYDSSFYIGVDGVFEVGNATPTPLLSNRESSWPPDLSVLWIEKELGVIEQKLKERGNWCFSNKRDGRVLSFSFGREDSFDLFRWYPEIMFFDLVQESNIYKVPVLNIMGIEATGKDFCIATTLMSEMRPEDVIEVLQYLGRKMSYSPYQPQFVFLSTSCFEFTCGPVRSVYPHSQIRISRDDLLTTIAKTQAVIGSERLLFRDLTTLLVESNSVGDYGAFLRVFKIKGREQPAYKHVISTWLPYKKHFIAAWTQDLNLGYDDPYEKMQLLRELRVRSSPWKSLTELVDTFEEAIAESVKSIKIDHKHQRVTPNPAFKSSFYFFVSGQIAANALKLVQSQRDLEKPSSQCTHRFMMKHGLPCSHRVHDIESSVGHLVLEDFHPHWHLLPGDLRVFE
ncbi:hypothetical protein DICA2_E18008 [Diutina catenulata]